LEITKDILINKFIPSAVPLCIGLLVASYAEVTSQDTKASYETKQKEGKNMSTVSIRYMIDDVPAAIKFYTTHLGFSLDQDASPAFASVSRDGVRLLLSGKTSSGRRAMSDGRQPVPGGWNRIHTQVDDIAAEVKRLRDAGLKFRNEIIKGPGGSQILLDDPSGNPVELFEAAR
jgi:predicted enzyme related to lactoylglutathione lyase